MEFAGEEAGRPLTGGDGLHLATFAGGHQDDEAGEIIGLGTEAVENPRTHAGTAGEDHAGIHDGVGRVVIDLLCPHGFENADVIGDAADVREEFADLLAGFAETFEAVLGKTRRTEF